MGPSQAVALEAGQVRPAAAQRRGVAASELGGGARRGAEQSRASVKWGRATSPAQRVCVGVELFERVCHLAAHHVAQRPARA